MRRRGVSVSLLALALVLVASLAAPSSGLGATPADQAGWGWVYVRLASGYSSYTPQPSDSANAFGEYGDSLVTRLGTGHYSVIMHDTGDGYGNVQVTPVSTVLHLCSVANWSTSGGDETIDVRCWDGAGHHADSPFVVDYNDGFYQDNSADPDTGLAYAFIYSDDQAHPTGPYIYNSTGLSTSVQHLATGKVLVKFFGFHHPGGNVQVTAYGTASGACTSQGWQQDGSSRLEGTLITVVCRNAAGTLVDRPFSILYARSTVPALEGAYALANEPSTASYVPANAYRWPNESDDAQNIVRVTRSAKGVYAARVDGFTPGGSLPVLTGGAEVTAMSSGITRCQLASVSTKADPRTVGVRCFDGKGHLADSKFAFLFTYSAGA